MAGMLEQLTYRKMLAWTGYLRVRARGPDQFVRDPDVLQDWAANNYG